MSACFYDMGGWMVSLTDIHLFVAAPCVPHPLNHLATTPFDRWSRSGETPTLTSEGMMMAQQGFKNTIVPHVPLTLEAPDPLEAIVLVQIHATSSSTAVLSRGTVTSGGKPLAMCILGWFGLNANCGGGPGLVLNGNSVLTTASIGDALGAFVSIAIHTAIGELLKLLPVDLLGPALDVARFIFEQIYKKVYADTFDDLRDLVRELVDELL